MKSNILLYKNSILFDIDRRYKIDKFSGKFELLSKKVVYSIDYEYNKKVVDYKDKIKGLEKELPKYDNKRI